MREMKDSGVPWIGNIPVDWQLVGVKRLFSIGRGRVIAQTELEETGYPVYSSQTKDNGCLGYIDTYDYDYPQLTWTTDGANAGSIFLRTGYYNCTNVCGTLNPTDGLVDLRYQKYALEHIAYSERRIDTNGYKIMNNEMAIIKTLLPPLSVQHQIADYLDTKCAQIDTIIDNEQSVIEKLQEYKKALITEAVTKGLNPNVNMKESGLDWIGKVPETYSLIKLKFLGEYFNGLTYSPDNLTDVDEGVLVLRSSNIKNGKLVLDDNVYVNVDTPRYLVKKNDILICSRNGSRNLVGKNILLSEDIHAYFGAFMMIFRLKSEVYSKWVYYVLNSNLFLAYLGSFFSSTINQLTGKDFGNIIIPICDVEEAKQITECLDEKCSNIDSIILKKQFTIDKLIEYKKSLIYEVVTGKKEVLYV